MRKPLNVAAPLSVQALYTVDELAMAGNVSRYKLRRILVSHGVSFVTQGRGKSVPLTELEQKVPLLWESLKAVQMLTYGL